MNNPAIDQVGVYILKQRRHKLISHLTSFKDLKAKTEPLVRGGFLELPPAVSRDIADADGGGTVTSMNVVSELLK